MFFSRPGEGQGGPLPRPIPQGLRPALFLDRALWVKAGSAERTSVGGGGGEFGCGSFSLSKDTMEAQILKRNDHPPLANAIIIRREGC